MQRDLSRPYKLIFLDINSKCYNNLLKIYLMNILVVGASIREFNWWNSIRKISTRNKFIFLNCSSQSFKGCINLNENNYKNLRYQVSVSEEFTIPLELLNFERQFYPNLSINQLNERILIHYNLFTTFLNQNTIDIVYVENGSFAFINALFLACKNLKKPLVILETADIFGTCFAYLNNKGPDLNYAVINPLPTLEEPTNIESLLIQTKDKNYDKRLISDPITQIYKIILYLRRRMKSKYVNIDGSFYVGAKIKLEYYPKLLFAYIHKLKNLICFNSKKKNIIIPLHLEFDLHLLERTNYLDQIDFVSDVIEANKDKQVLFKLHPHSVMKGITLKAHIRLLFMNCLITSKKANELNPLSDEVHTLGSKFGLQAARNHIKTFIYGDTFFASIKDKSTKENKYKVNLLATEELENFISSRRYRINLYNHVENEIIISSRSIENLSKEVLQISNLSNTE